ncbi:MAG: RNA-dependent DNA polymerase [Armatimonadetes bacterium]|nr:RNA-dependent DNA polymerase [Armatimonadota bacterium]
MKRHDDLFEGLVAFDNLLACARRAALGKRHRPEVSDFLVRLEANVLALQRELQDGAWRPGRFREFLVREPKPRLISAAPFRDRVVHHALVSVLEPIYEKSFIFHSYACRKDKGTHAALRQYRKWIRSSKYFLKMDVRKFFPSVDHEILMKTLARKISDRRVLDLARRIVDGSNRQETVDLVFAGDDPAVAAARRRGLPIGNQTSQFFANMYLDPLDQFVTRTLGFGRYLRYVDDLVVLGGSAEEMHDARRRIEEFGATLRLRFHERKGFVAPVSEGLRLLGYRVTPDSVRLPRESVLRARRRLRRLSSACTAGSLPLERVTASVQSWIGHASHADTWRLRERLFSEVRITCPAG